MTTPALPAPSTRPSSVPLGPALRQLTLVESRRLTREPMFLIGTVGFPVLFYALFGLPREGLPAAASRITLLNLAAFSLVSLSLFSFGAHVAAERTGGWLRLLRTSPVRLPTYIAAKVLAAWMYGALSLALLFTFAGVVGDVWLSTAGLQAALKLLLGMSALVALGLMLGLLVRPAAATVVTNVASLLLVFASGLAMPLEMLPAALGRVAPLLPTYHLGVVGRSPLLGAEHEALSWLVLLGYTLLFGAVAAWALRRDEARE